jgi:hypothetical protein
VKFTGQVRVPEIDHPGVPATILVEDDQVEVFLEGESLGRWSLYDVEASRLVSAAFSLSLDNEEITFIADEPVDFAYKGVDHMAEEWARFKSMTMPRRVVAVGRSRRGTLPSRIGELRAAMLQNLETAGRGVPRLAPVETVGQTTIAPPEPAPITPATPMEPAAAKPDTEFRPAPVEEVGPQVNEEKEPSIPDSPPRLRPGAGLFARRLDLPAPAADTPEPIPAPPPVPEPVFRSPWDEPAHEAVARAEPDRVEEPEPLPPLPVVPEPVVEPEQVFAPAHPVPERDLPVPSQEEEAEPVAPAAAAEVPELVKELLGTSSDEGGEEGARDLVVDLGHYEGRGSQGEQPAEVQSDGKEPVLTGAPPEPERAGLLGAVRSAFARNKVVHEHAFVEAPGGIGIVRQICEECGYISIGVSD